MGDDLDVDALLEEPYLNKDKVSTEDDTGVFISVCGGGEIGFSDTPRKRHLALF